MEKELQVNEYNTLMSEMHSLCDEMPDVIFLKYFDTNKYLYSLYLEAFNSIKGVCILLRSGCLISQAAAVMRMAIERVATIRVIESNKELMEIYIDHHKLRFEIRDKEKDEKREIIRDHFKEKIKKGDNPNEFLEYGWMKKIDEDYGLDKLIELSKIQDDDAIKKWKDQLNFWVHGAIELVSLGSHEDGMIIYAHALIQLAAKLLDIIVCEFHNDTKFDFIIEGKEYFKSFRKAYENTNINRNK